MSNQNPVKQLRIATRKSKLALQQAELVKAALLDLYPYLSITLLPILSEGDKHLETPLFTEGGKGLFVKELETELLHGRADLAVHSMKDMPVQLPEGLEITCILKREDPRDVLITHKKISLKQLPNYAVIGSSSLRRQAQILQLRSDLTIKFLRGNVETRLKKLENGEFDAIILAAAGLKRLNLQNHITEYFTTQQFLPAIGQGALGLECRSDNLELKKLLQPLNHHPTWLAVLAEREMNACLNGGCQLPVAGFAHIEKNMLILEGMVLDSTGKQYVKAQACSPLEKTKGLGNTLGITLLKLGADKIIQACIKENVTGTL